MTSTVAREVVSALSEFSTHTRLYELRFKDQRKDPGILVETFAADERLLGIGSFDVFALSTRSKIAHASLLGQDACLQISLADGTRVCYSGYLSRIATLGSDGGLSRYRLRLSPWIWLLIQTRNSRAWQDKSVIEIIDSVFAQYQPHAQWVWSGDVNFFMRDAVARSYCCQYRETDLDFVTRLLTEEGLGCSCMVLFSDTSQLSAALHDPSSEGVCGIRYHAASSVEKSDSIQYLQAFRKLGVAVVTVLSCGSQTAIVVGPDGSDEPNGADEMYCDRLGRVRIRFHWQESDAGCWVRVGQRSAGSQFLPRIGQEVLVKFIEGDIDRPVIVGALYNGRGEGGVPPTPGGVSDRVSSSAAFARAHDHLPSARSTKPEETARCGMVPRRAARGIATTLFAAR